ncbi:TIGR04452 family lipoprotein [Leptospira interrogans]|uniref:TIGR04452 family lipoprotein n=1 Tax=Leptospira interrogans TaxID=173 RepID=UPI0009E5A6A4|nr:TIGR04452 family lipoprotein [Leptospira interrogans]
MKLKIKIILFTIFINYCSITGYEGEKGSEVKKSLSELLISLALADNNTESNLIIVNIFLNRIEDKTYYREDPVADCKKRISYLFLRILDSNFTFQINCNLKAKGYFN